MKINVEMVSNGFILRVGADRPHVVTGHDPKALAEKLAELFGLKEDE